MNIDAIVPTVSGASVLGLVAFDVYATVLHSRARGGPIGENLNRGAWWVAGSP